MSSYSHKGVCSAKWLLPRENYEVISGEQPLFSKDDSGGGKENVFRAFYSIQNANSLIQSHGEIYNILTIQITYYIE